MANEKCTLWEGEVDIRGYPKGRPEIDKDVFLLPEESWSKTCGEKLCVNPAHQRVKTHTSWWLKYTEEWEGCSFLRADLPLLVALERTGGGQAQGSCCTRCIKPEHRINVPMGKKPDWMLTEDWELFQLSSGPKTPDAMVDWLREKNAWVHPSYLGRTWAAARLNSLEFKPVSSGRGRPKRYYRIKELEG